MAQTVTLTDYKKSVVEQPTWCPGCGDFPALAAMQRALVNLGKSPDEVVVVGGIGCSGKAPSYTGAYGMHAVHGRSIPVASGIKLGNRDLTVIAFGGDGDGYGIGLSHFLHAIRRNIDITYIVMDNHIYGLTTGQASPTSRKGMKTKTSPYGTAEWPIRPLETALAAGASFVAQGFSGDVKQLTGLIEQAIQHRGFSHVNVLSPCVTFNKEDTYEFWRTHCVNLDEDPDYDPTDRVTAIKKVMQHDALVRGLLFREERRSYQDELPGYAAEPLARLEELTIRPDAFQDILRDFT